MIGNYLFRLLPKKVANDLRLNKPNLQEYFFRLSLKEIGVYRGRVKVNHYDGFCWHIKTGWVPICFPMSMISTIERIDRTKTINYFFSGVITEQRKWLEKYPNVTDCSYGRNPEKKYSLDLKYYRNLSSSRFGLAPVGDCPWSYRFFESIMCRSIPILGDADTDIYSQRFSFFRDSEKHVYDNLAAENNYCKFLRHHVLQSSLHLHSS